MPMPRTPNELHRRRGTFRPDRHGSAPVVLLPASDGAPEPPRPLGPEGRRLWARVWEAGRSWLAPSDLDLVLLLCETMDERVVLRLHVLRAGDDFDWRDRVALRHLDEQVESLLSALALTPSDRSRLGVAEVRRASALDDLLARRDDDA
jgi:hypothetical protein